jgi:hypothetical protein
MRLLALASLLSTGCAASFANLTTPTTLDPGQGEFQFAPTGFGVAPVPDRRNGTATVLMPNVEMGYRWGQGDGREVGIHAWVAGLGTDLKQRLVEGPVSLAVDPGIALGMQFLYFGEGPYAVPAAALKVPLLVGVRVGDRVELLAAPQAAGMFALAPAIFFAGGSTGARVRIGKGISAMAEVVAMRSFVPYDGAGFWTLQAALALILERAPEPVREPLPFAGPRE